MTDDLMKRQEELEAEMSTLGSKRFWDAVVAAREGHQESATAYGQHIISRMIDPLTTAIEEWLVEAWAGKPGRRQRAAYLLREIDPQVAAFITLRACFERVTARSLLQRAALAVGMGIEDEARFTQFVKSKKFLFEKLIKDLNVRNCNRHHKRTVLIHTMNKYAEKHGHLDLKWKPWSSEDSLHVGQKLIDLMIQSTHLFKVETVKLSPRNTAIYLSPLDDTLSWIDERNALCELMSPDWMPTIVPPKPWKHPYSSPYHTMAVRKVPLVKISNENYLEELSNRVHDMPALYRSINAIQETPWRINRDVLQVFSLVWEAGLGVGDVVTGQEIPLPVRPVDIDTNKEARREWRHRASRIHMENNRNRSRRLQSARILYLARKFEVEAAIYFPMQLDFRGRMYAMPSFLNPQGNDLAKSLLTFANGKRLGASGLGWLKIAGANRFGFDKASFEGRIEWVDQHSQEILACANDPLEHRWWMDADEPWQFLAFCLEYRNAMRELNPEDYVSSIPVSVDGACNGLQNFSAMLRDEVGGEAVNLIPSDKPKDIYQCVADVAMEKVQADAATGNPIALQWLAFGFDRKAAKRPVMVLPYGGTLYSAKEYLQDYIKERVEKGGTLPWADDQNFTASKYLAEKIWNSIGEVVIAARSAMAWLQKSASVAAKEGLPVTWTTPVGFPVLQSYPEVEARRVKTRIGDSIIRMTLLKDKGTLDKRRQAQGISPNYVHSMDAANLMLTTARAADEGITNFAMVHDSYGTLAADLEHLSVCLRQAFVDIYREDVLAKFRESLLEGLSEKNAAKLPEVPQKGSLDIEAVKHSRYFFA